MLVTALLFTTAFAAAAPSGLGKVDYCTEAGPIYLDYSTEPPQGSYRILLPGRDIAGALELAWADGYLAGTWRDHDGHGPILIVLHDDGQSLTALYSAADEPLSWEAVWRGERRDVAADKYANCPLR